MPSARSSSTRPRTVTVARVLIIGLDGATFDLIRPWAAQGKLPHLQNLMEGGTWAPLESTRPPMTSPAWPSCRAITLPRTLPSQAASTPAVSTSLVRKKKQPWIPLKPYPPVNEGTPPP